MAKVISNFSLQGALRDKAPRSAPELGRSEGPLSPSAMVRSGSVWTVGVREELPLDKNAKGIETSGQ